MSEWPYEKAVALYLIHWNAPDWCRDAVATLVAAAPGAQVTVIDNASIPRPEWGALLPDHVRLVELPANLGYAGAANVALTDWRTQIGQVPLIGICAHDVLIERDAIERLVEAFTRTPGLGVAAPALTGPFESTGGRWDGLHAEQVSTGIDSTELVLPRDWVSGTFMMISGACAMQVDFDATLHSYGEDLAYCLRARDFGWSVGCVPQARAAGRGSVDPGFASVAIVRNQLRVAWRRARYRERPMIALRASVDFIGNGVACIAPWRSPSHRQASRSFFRVRLNALRSLVAWRPGG